MEHSEGKITTNKHRVAKNKREVIELLDENFIVIGRIYGSDKEANAERIHILWNAADNKPTAEAVRFIEEGPEMLAALKCVADIKDWKHNNKGVMEMDAAQSLAAYLVAKMEGK